MSERHDAPPGGEEPTLAEAQERIRRLEATLREQRAELGLVRLQLEMLSSTDVVTGLPNLTGIMQTLERQIAWHRRTQEPFGLMLIELAGLGPARDAGRGPLEDALRHCGAMISAGLRQSDTVGRIDERTFVAVLPDLEASGVAAVMARIETNLLAMPPYPGEGALPVTPAFAVVLVGAETPTDATALLEAVNTLRTDATPGVPAIAAAGVE